MIPRDVEFGVFGGSGFYSFLEDVEPVSIHTPYGAPSDQFAVGTVEGRRVAFLPRHGAHHHTPAHVVNYRANLWALRELGVRRVIAPCAVGSLQPHIEPGHMVVLDQLVDRTNGRKDTFFDGPITTHVSLADPYCPELRSVVVEAGRATGRTVHDGGTVVVISGPRFSTRAESQWYRAAGWHTINMTQYPEAALARELGICFAGVALVTDYDTGLEGVDGIEPVAMAQVFAVLKANVDHTREWLRRAIPAVPVERSCSCASALEVGPLAGS